MFKYLLMKYFRKLVKGAEPGLKSEYLTYEVKVKIDIFSTVYSNFGMI